MAKLFPEVRQFDLSVKYFRSFLNETISLDAVSFKLLKALENAYSMCNFSVSFPNSPLWLKGGDIALHDLSRGCFKELVVDVINAQRMKKCSPSNSWSRYCLVLATLHWIFSRTRGEKYFWQSTLDITRVRSVSSRFVLDSIKTFQIYFSEFQKSGFFFFLGLNTLLKLIYFSDINLLACVLIGFRIQLSRVCVFPFNSWKPVLRDYRWNARALCCLATLLTWHFLPSRSYSALTT